MARISSLQFSTNLWNYSKIFFQLNLNTKRSPTNTITTNLTKQLLFWMESRLCLCDYTILKLAKHVCMASRDFRFSNLFCFFLSFALLGFFFDSFFSKKSKFCYIQIFCHNNCNSNFLDQYECRYCQLINLALWLQVWENTFNLNEHLKICKPCCLLSLTHFSIIKYSGRCLLWSLWDKYKLETLT